MEENGLKFSEKSIQAEIVETLRAMGCIVWSTPNEAVGRGRYAAMQALRSTGLTAGAPDLTVVTPSGYILFAEIKSESGRLSPAQRDLHEQLAARGICVRVWRSSVAAAAASKVYL